MVKKQKTNRKSQKTSFFGRLNRTYNLKKILPIAIGVIGIGAIGSYFTFFSSAAVATPEYQYSVSTCPASASTGVVACRDKSAEALTYRYYRALKNADPDNGGYKFWAQKLAGERLQPTDIGNKMVAEINTVPADNASFVKMVYKNLNGGNIDSGGLDYFTRQLAAKTWSRGQIVAHMATQNGAMAKQAPSWANYLKIVGPAPITQSAALAQQKRTDKTLVYATVAKNKYGKAPEMVNLGRQQRDQAKTIAAKSSVSKSDLTAIASKEKTVKNYITFIAGPTKEITNAMNENKKLTAEAAPITAYSPDISNAAIKSNNDKTIYIFASINNVNSDLRNLVNQISGSYKTAEGKYEAGQRRIAAAAAAAEASSSGTQNGSGGGNTQPVPAGIKSQNRNKEELAGSGAPQYGYASPLPKCSLITYKISPEKLAGGYKYTCVHRGILAEYFPKMQPVRFTCADAQRYKPVSFQRYKACLLR